jgi:hypothetical protein
MAASEWAVSKREDQLRDSADADLPMLALADAASRVVADVTQRADTKARPGEAAKDYRRLALWFMAIITFRALRAAIQAIRAGYEDQALGYVRLIEELHKRAQKARDDESGSYASEWLEGRNPGKGAKLAGQDFWEMLSGPVHANVRAVLDWIAVPQSEGGAMVVIGPERRPEIANPSLVYMAGEARDIAVMLALEADCDIDVSAIDAWIARGHAEWLPDVQG